MENTDMKKCPFCAEWIKTEAVKCRYCGSDLNRKGFNLDMFSTPGYWHRVNEGKQVAGVCTGIARQLDAPILILPLRLFFVLTTIFYGFGVILYIILYILMPPDTQDLHGNGATHGPTHHPGKGPQQQASGQQSAGQSPGSNTTAPPQEDTSGQYTAPVPEMNDETSTNNSGNRSDENATHDSDEKPTTGSSGNSRISDAEFIEIKESEPETTTDTGKTGTDTRGDTPKQDSTDNMQHTSNRMLSSIVAALMIFTIYVMTLSHVLHISLIPEPYIFVIGGGIILAGIAMRSRGRLSATPKFAD